MILPILMILLMCLQVETPLRPGFVLKKVKEPWQRRMRRRARLYLYVYSIRIYVGLKRGVLRVYRAIPRPKARGNRLFINNARLALKYYKDRFTVLSRFKLRCGILSEMTGITSIKRKLELYCFQGPPSQPSKRTMKPGVIDGKNHALVDETDEDDESVLSWTSKYSKVSYKRDGTQKFKFKVPKMVDTGRKDEDDNPIFGKDFDVYKLKLNPNFTPTGFVHKPFQEKVKIRSEKKTRPKIASYKLETKDVTMPGGNVVQQQVSTPVYETKIEKGPDGEDRTVNVMEDYDQDVIGDVPPSLELQYSWGMMKIEQGKTKTKESFILDIPKQNFKWTIRGSNINLNLIVDPSSPEFGGIKISAFDGSSLGANIPKPSGHDAKGHPIDLHWEIEGDQLTLKVDTELDKPYPRPPPPPKQYGPDGKEIPPQIQPLVMPAFPITIDPSVNFEGTRIEISGSANTLPSMKTLYEEHFDNVADAVALDTYDSNWVVTKAGASVAETDTSQFHSGNSSLVLTRDGANDVSCYNDAAGDFYDNVRFTKWFRLSDTGSIFYYRLYDSSGNVLCEVEFENTPKIYITHGDGVGGNNVVDAGAYAQDDWIKVTFDIDVTNDKYRTWIDDVLWSGPNANAGGWDNFYSDRTATAIDRFGFLHDFGASSVWIDDITIELGDETYSYGNLPYNANEITEAVSPTGTLSGVDGDWDIAYGTGTTIAVSSTYSVIGTNSITTAAEITDTAGDLGIKYQFDTVKDVSNYEGVEGYLRYNSAASALPDTSLYVIVWDLAGQTLSLDIKALIVEGKFYHFKANFSAMTDSGTFDKTKVERIIIYGTYSVTGNAGQFWLDAWHFYGNRNGRGSGWSSQSIQTLSGTTTQLNRTVPSPAVNSPINSKNVTLTTLLSIESAPTIDYSGNGNDFTMSSSITPEGNPIYGGTHVRGDFDGVNDELHFQGSAHATSTGAVSCWFEADTIAAGLDEIWTFWGGDANRISLRRSGSTLQIINNINAGTDVFYIADIVADRAYHFTWKWDNTYWHFWLDGKKVARIGGTIGSQGTDDLVDPIWYIGCWKDAAATLQFFDGAIWDVCYYNVSTGLTDDQITQLAGAGKDLYIDDSKGITINASGTRYEHGRRYPEEPNELCEATPEWAPYSGSLSLLNDAVYGTNSVRVTRAGTGFCGYNYRMSSLAWNLNLQKITGSKSTIAKYGKAVMWMKASNASEYIDAFVVYMGGSSGNVFWTGHINIPLTSYWKKYEINLSALSVTGGTLDWSDVDGLQIYTVGGSTNDTIDINDLHFEERIVTDRSTTSGYYDNRDYGILDMAFAEVNHSTDGLYLSGTSFKVKNSTVINPAYYGIQILGGAFDIGDSYFHSANVNYSAVMNYGVSMTFERCIFNENGNLYGVRFYQSYDAGMTLLNCVFATTYAPGSSRIISYNHNNIQGSHKIYGNVPFSSTSVSDFPRSKTRLTNSSKGWGIQGGLGTVERTVDNVLFLTNDDGADASIKAGVQTDAAIDIGAVSDSNHPNNFKVKIKTNGADAAWSTKVYFSTAGIGTDYIQYDGASEGGDIDATRTIDVSGSPTSTSGTSDRTNINYIYIELNGIATGAEKVKVWLDELYLETDAGKVKFEPSAAIAGYKTLIGSSTSLIIDQGTTTTWDDTSGAGFDSASVGALVCLGTSGSHVTMTSAGAPPTNYWNLSAILNLTADYTDFKYHSKIAVGTWDMDNCTSDYAETADYAISIDSGATVTSFTNITISNTAYGLNSAKTITGLDNIVFASVSTIHIQAKNARLEFTNSNFDATICSCDSTGIIGSKDHNDVAGDFVVVMADADTVLFSEFTTEPDSGDDIYLYVESGGTSSTFTFDEAKIMGNLTVQSGKSIITSFTANFTLNGSTINVYQISNTATTLRILAGATITWHDLSGCGFASGSTGTIQVEGLVGSHVYFIGGGTPPTNVPAMFCTSLAITGDYMHWSYGGYISIGTYNFDHLYIDHTSSGSYCLYIPSGRTLTRCTNVTITDVGSKYGLHCGIAYTFDGMNISGESADAVYANGVKLEFTNSNFDITHVGGAGATSWIVSKDHAGVGAKLSIVLRSGATHLYSTIVNTADAYDDVYLYGTRAGYSTATFSFDVGGLEFGILYQQAGKTFTIDWGTYTGPSAPTLAAIDYSVDDQLTLNWTAPSITGGWARMSYNIYDGSSSPPTNLLTSPASTAITYTDAPLAPRTTKFYKICGVNSVGEGTFSAIRTEMSAGPPNVPLTLAIALEFDRSLSMTWLTPADDGHHTITGYNVYRGTSSPPTALLSALGVVLYKQDMTVINRTLYYYLVKAVNSYGEGAASNIISDTPECHGPIGQCLNHLVTLVTIKPRNNATASGTPKYGNSYQAYSRVAPASIRNRDMRGEEALAKNSVLLDGSVPVSELDAIVLPDGRTGMVLRVNDASVKGIILQREALT